MVDAGPILSTVSLQPYSNCPANINMQGRIREIITVGLFSSPQVDQMHLLHANTK